MKEKAKKTAKILPFRKRTEKPFDVVAFAKKKLKEEKPGYFDFYPPKEPA